MNNNREIAERLVLLMDDIDPWSIPSVREIFDFVHETEADLERGGSETLKILRKVCEDYEGYDDITGSAKELINLIHE